MSTPATAGCTIPAAHRDAGAASALVMLLDHLRDLLAQIPPSVYRACPAPRVSGSIGEHVRHCLDHVEAFASAGVIDELSYDQRRRGTCVEADPRAAIAQVDRLIQEVLVLTAGGLDRPLQVASLLERGGAPDVARSSVRRELAFVISHTTHHLALIALLLDRVGWQCRDGLGLAPSSPQRH